MPDPDDTTPLLGTSTASEGNLWWFQEMLLYVHKNGETLLAFFIFVYIICFVFPKWSTFDDTIKKLFIGLFCLVVGKLFSVKFSVGYGLND
jgi:hypothetical protein